MFHPSIIWRSSRQEIKRELTYWYNSIRWETVISGMFSYYSVWNLISIFVSSRIALPDMISYVPWLMALQCSIGGFHLTHLYPRRILISYLNIYLDYGVFLIMMDILAHQIPLLYVTRPQEKMDLVHWLPGNIPFLIYWYQFSVFDKYEMDMFNVLFCFMIYSLLCILLR